MRKTVFIPVTLIQSAHSDDWLRSLAWFVRLKSLYQNNTHYNFSLRSLAAKLSCSPECLRHHLQVLERQELIRYHSGNITFLGLWAIQKMLSKKCSHYISTVGVPVDKINQLDILRTQLIRFNLSAQSYNIKKSERQKCHKRQSCIRKNHEMTGSCYTGLSAVGIGRMFDLSQTQGARIRAKMKAIGLLQVTRKYQVLIKDVSFQHYRELKRLQMIPAYAFYRDGNVLREQRTELAYCKDMDAHTVRTAPSVLKLPPMPEPAIQGNDIPVLGELLQRFRVTASENHSYRQQKPTFLPAKTPVYSAETRGNFRSNAKSSYGLKPGALPYLPAHMIQEHETPEGPTYEAALQYFTEYMQDECEGQEIIREAQKFFCHNAGIGWYIRGRKIYDWKAAARGWIRKTKNLVENATISRSNASISVDGLGLQGKGKESGLRRDTRPVF